MNDDFDRFLASALGPDERLPDRTFVAKVQIAVQMEERFSAARKALLARLVLQALALGAITLAVLTLARSAVLAEVVARNPVPALACVITAFAFLLLVIARSAEPDRPARRLPL